LTWPHFVRSGPSSPSPQRAPPPTLDLYLLRPNGCIDQDAAWYRDRPRPSRLCVRWEHRSPPQKGGGTPKCSAHVYCGQTAGWIKMALGMEVGLSPGDFVLDGDPAPSSNRRRILTPIFGPFLLWPNSWMQQDATWCGGRPQPRGLCFRWGLSPPNFRPMFMIVIVISLEH